jgi:hypothetical protein
VVSSLAVAGLVPRSDLRRACVCAVIVPKPVAHSVTVKANAPAIAADINRIVALIDVVPSG